MSAAGGRTVVVTGAAGFLGRYLCRHFAAAGWSVRGFVRRPEDAAAVLPGVTLVRGDLPDAIDPAAFAGADVVVHAAWATKETDLARARRVNEDGTRRLFEVARTAGVGRIVFVSTIAAAADAPSYYGRSKHAAEAWCDPGRDLVVRPGLILGREGQGLFQQMRDVMRRLHVVPLFGGGRQPLQTVHVDDLCAGVVRAVERGLTGVVTIAEPTPPTLGGFLRLLAVRMGIRCLFVPLPFGPVLGAVRLFERAGVPFPLRSESLLGMRGLRAVPVDADLRRLDLAVRSAEQSLATLV